MTAIARRLDATEGQVWSLAIGLVVAVVLALAGIPPVVHHAREPLAQSSTAAHPAPSHGGSALTPVTQPAVAEPDAGAPAAAPTRHVRVPSSAGSSVASPSAATAEPFGTITSFASAAAPLGGVTVAAGRVYVATDDGQSSHILGFTRAGSRTTDITLTGQPGGHTRGVTALATEQTGMLVAADAASARVLRIDPATGAVSTVATIVDLPSCVLAPGAPACEPGLEDHAPLLTGISTSADGTILVADAAQSTIWRIRPGGKPEAWSQSVQQASGEGPTAITIAPDGSVLTTVGTDLNPANATAAAVYRIPVAADGTAGTPVLLAKLARGDQPTGIAAAPGGRVFVALHATSTIVVFNSDGAEQSRLTDSKLGAASGLALGDAGELFGTTRPSSGTGQVVRVAT